MKKLLFILFLIPIMGFGQPEKYLPHDGKQTMGNSLIYENSDKISPLYKSPEERYIDFCKADSNKITVGYTFILTDRKKNPNSYVSIECYNPAYRFMLVNYNTNYLNFIEGANFDDPAHVYDICLQNAKRKYGSYQNDKYYEVQPIKMSPIPTFEGFVNWKKQFCQ